MNPEAHRLKVLREGQHIYQMNDDYAYTFEPLVDENSFLTKEKDHERVPVYEDIQALLPKLIWDENPEAVSCYEKAWQIAFSNLHQVMPGDGMVSNYIDAAFNGNLFMWDSSFMTMFGRYGSRVFNFQKTLDNFYANQHYDGFICRELIESQKGDRFHRFDPVSTGPNIMPWAEWEYFQQTGDLERVRKIFAPLLAYHLWLKSYRTWPDGSYWSSGFGCGMDNQPRLMPGYNPKYHHGHMVWADACIQQIISCNVLIEMAGLIGREKDVGILRDEKEKLTAFINEKLWDDETAFYYDLWADGKQNGVKSVGAYWALLAGIVPEDKLDAFLAHLENEKEFNRPHCIPTLSADHPQYDRLGGYWKGSVWAPTNYMVLKGLEKYGRFDLARKIACNHLANVLEVFRQTGTLWENYAPEEALPGKPAKGDFVGWTGLVPIAVAMEQVFGICSLTSERKIIWRINETSRHGVLNYPMGSDTVNLICPAHQADEKPKILVSSTCGVTVEVIWPDGTKVTYNT